MITIDENTSYSLQPGPMGELLTVQAPRAPEDSPPIFTFSRKREVEIPWSKMVDESRSSVQAMRQMFEDSWGLKAIDVPSLSNLVAKSEAEKSQQMIGDLDAAQVEPNYRAKSPVFRTQFTADNKVAAEEISHGIVMKEGVSGRLYLLHAGVGEALSIQDFLSQESYEKAWDKIDSFELVFATKENAEGDFTNFEELDMRPAFIERRYKELIIMQQMAEVLDSAVPEQSTEEIKTLLQSGADAAEIESLYQRFLQLRMNKFDVDRELDKLVSFTSDLGYFLYLSVPKEEDANTFPVGKVCTKVAKTVRWQTVQKRPEVRSTKGFLGIRRKKVVQVKHTQQHSKVIQKPTPIDTSSNVLAKWQDTYRGENPDAEIYVFDQSGQGYITGEGIYLRDVIDRCRLDEDFRRQCVVILPIYEVALSGRRVVTKYHIFQRPMPGIIPSIMPRLSLVESLSYRTTWQGTELGELVSTVNLAPGEQRTIRLSKSYEQETVVSQTSSSMFELEDKSSSDLASEMESEFNAEQTQSANASLSTSVSGGGMFVSGSASATAGVSTSGREFAKTVNKVAKRASKSVSSRNKQEVSASSSARTTINTRDESEAHVRNGNEGRTLNLMFHRLYNRYRGGLYLDGLQFEVIPSVELIEGSGVYDGLVFGLKDFRKVIDLLSATPLPFATTPKMLSNLGMHVLESLENLLQSEYADTNNSGRLMASSAAGDNTVAASESIAPATSMGVMAFNASAVPVSTFKKVQEREAAMESMEQRLNAAVISTQSNKPIEPIDLVVATAGLYLDAMVGVQPSTEPYSEKMRQLETRMRNAEVFSKQAEAMLQRAQAMRIARMVGGNNSLVMTSIDYDRRTLMSLKLGVSGAIPGDNWTLLVDQQDVGGDIKVSDDNLVTITFAHPQEWLKSEDLFMSVSLYNPVLGLTISFAELAVSPLA